MAYGRQRVALLVVSIIFPLFAAATLALRVHARSLSQKKHDVSDYFIFFAMVNERDRFPMDLSLSD